MSASPFYFLFTTFGTAGDVHPLLGIGRELRARGHEVSVIAQDYFAERVRQAGLDFRSLGSREEYEEVMQHPDLWHPRKSFAIIADAIARSLKRCYALLDKEDPRGKVLVATSLSLWTRLLQEKLGWRLATLHLQPSMLWSAYDTPILPGFHFPSWVSPAWRRRIWFFLNRRVTDPKLAPPLNRLRWELGLKPVQDVFLSWMHSPELVIGAFPAWFASPQSDWPKSTRLTSFVFYDQAQEKSKEDEAVARALEFCRSGEPPILFTAGSAMLHAKEFFEQSLLACERLKRRALFVSPAGTPMPPPSESFRHFIYLPFGRVASRLATMVHHGGIGTAAQALRGGIPQLIVPLTHDQPDNAARLERFGVSRTIPSRKYREASAAEALTSLLGSPRVSENCARYAERIAQERDGAESTADLLESFARAENLN